MSRARAPVQPPAGGPRRGTRRLPVVEIFGPTLQGEGRVIGLKTMFVRFAGCDYACSWCDTPYTWNPAELAPAEPLAPAEIAARLTALSGGCRDVTLTGGNPALHDLGPLVRLLRAAGWRVHVETQGSVAPAWLAEADTVTLSPKGPTSGMRTDWDVLARAVAMARDPDLKVVVFDEADYEYAVEVGRRFPGVPLTLQVGNRVGQEGAEDWLRKLDLLAARALADPRLPRVRVLPQLHVLLWGNRRGV
jgi:7-carboxy-7-deazaguanine synthase